MGGIGKFHIGLRDPISLVTIIFMLCLLKRRVSSQREQSQSLCGPPCEKSAAAQLALRAEPPDKSGGREDPVHPRSGPSLSASPLQVVPALGKLDLARLGVGNKYKTCFGSNIRLASGLQIISYIASMTQKKDTVPNLMPIKSSKDAHGEALGSLFLKMPTPPPKCPQNQVCTHKTWDSVF